ncbi:MAG: ATP-dependent RNA helicase HrpA [Candidatus Aminicenantales bacterium]
MSLTTGEPAPIAQLVRGIRALLPRAMLRDRAAAARRLRRLDEKYELPRFAKTNDGDRRSRISFDAAATKSLVKELASLEKRLEQSVSEREQRHRRRPAVHYPPALPITAKRHEIVRAIRHHPVVIISGETGCGKSTQIPKMCLQAGRGIAGKIGCTQPRRIAAITIAHRIAEELGETLGRSVGYKIRFQDRAAREGYIKIMTDGMLLAETQSDRRLAEYDTLIIDEAHERSLNIDFLLGIVRSLLDVRPELKVVITSATLDTEKFSEAFGGAPVIHVGGRLYPVELEYMPPESFSKDTDESDYVDMAVRAVERLKSRRQAGDILVFMPTEQDILETCDKLEGKHYAATTGLPLYARLPAAQQGRVYSVSGPKIVVATNVAETSLTIPGIRYVIDTGLARISQYQPGTRINSLPISPVSQASADQRKGRCGRVQEGLCVRLYSEEDYAARPEYTAPEILRSNLAEVILRMVYLNLGDPAQFPFVDRPHPRNIKDGYETLLELGAISKNGRDYELTPLGLRMAPMPLDPRISRMLIEAEKEGCLREVAVVASALSIRDPRERPPDKAGLADQAQAAFAHPDSDFLTLLNIWDRFHSPAENLTSKSKQRKYCEQHFLSYARMREWGFVHDQILSILKEQGIAPGRAEKKEMTPALYAGTHRSILSGFLSNIAVHKEKNMYQAAKGREVMIFPGSTLFGKSRPWIVAAEVVRTSRLFARMAARIDPSWLEESGGDLCRYSYSEPRWDRERGEVRAKERVSLFGLEVLTDRDVAYGPKNPEEAHKIFVNEALVEGEVKEPPPFLRHNLDLQKKILEMEEKLRRRDIMVHETAIADFYSRRLAGVYDLHGLEKRIRGAGGDGFLRMSEKDLVLISPDIAELQGFPDEFSLGEKRFAVSYKFSPGVEDDGATLRIPFGQIAAIPSEALEWGIPGQFKEKIAALIKGLPKSDRKQLMPFAETAETIAREMRLTDPSLYETLAKFVKRRFQADIPASRWASADIPGHLKMRVAVVDPEGRELAASRNIEVLRRAGAVPFVPEQSADWKTARATWQKEGRESWDFGPLPESVPVGMFMTAYPGLEPGETGVNIRLFKTEEEALASHVKGVEALLAAKFAKDVEFLRRYLVVFEEYGKTALYFGGKTAVEKGMIENIKREILRKNIRSREEFEAYGETVMRSLFEKSHALRETLFKIFDAYQETRRAIQEAEHAAGSSRAAAALCREVKAELEALVPKNFLDVYSLERLVHIPRYLEALRMRLGRGKVDFEKDRKKAEQVRPFVDVLRRLECNDLAEKDPSRQKAPETSPEKKKLIDEYRWMVEEFKVSLFAPELRTAFPISPKRLAIKIKEIEADE